MSEFTKMKIQKINNLLKKVAEGDNQNLSNIEVEVIDTLLESVGESISDYSNDESYIVKIVDGIPVQVVPLEYNRAAQMLLEENDLNYDDINVELPISNKEKIIAILEDVRDGDNDNHTKGNTIIIDLLLEKLFHDYATNYRIDDASYEMIENDGYGCACIVIPLDYAKIATNILANDKFIESNEDDFKKLFKNKLRTVDYEYKALKKDFK